MTCKRQPSFWDVTPMSTHAGIVSQGTKYRHVQSEDQATLENSELNHQWGGQETRVASHASPRGAPWTGLSHGHQPASLPAALSTTRGDRHPGAGRRRGRQTCPGETGLPRAPTEPLLRSPESHLTPGNCALFVPTRSAAERAAFSRRLLPPRALSPHLNHLTTFEAQVKHHVKQKAGHGFLMCSCVIIICVP